MAASKVACYKPAMEIDQLTTREVPLVPAQSALLFIDVQNYCAHRSGGEFKGLAPAEFNARYGAFFEHFETRTLPKMQRLQGAFRRAGIEVLYTVIENLTADGRDRSLDYKITGFNVPKGSWDGQVLEAIAPQGRRDRPA